EIDCARADAAVFDVIAHSRLSGAGAACVAAIRRTWSGSATARSIWQLERLAPAALAARLRFCARCVCAAALTVSILLPLSTSSGRVFQAIVRIVGLLAAAAVDRSAAAITRAWLDRRA